MKEHLNKVFHVLTLGVLQKIVCNLGLLNAGSATDEFKGWVGAPEHAVSLRVRLMAVRARESVSMSWSVRSVELGTIATMSKPVEEDKRSSSCSPEGAVLWRVDCASKGHGSGGPSLLLIVAIP